MFLSFSILPTRFATGEKLLFPFSETNKFMAIIAWDEQENFRCKKRGSGSVCVCLHVRWRAREAHRLFITNVNKAMENTQVNEKQSI